MTTLTEKTAAIMAAGAWILTPTLAHADAAATAAESSSNLQEITVTAQRREQNLQQVPIAVSAFSEEQLKSQQIVSTKDLEQFVPNLFASNNVGQGSANVYYIRGLGQTQSFPTYEPQVGTYVDDIYIARQNANNFALFGVEQLQVLNGPQGTLFGRNSTGGAIVVTLKKPGHEFGGDFEASYGQVGESSPANEVSGHFAVDIPINSQLLTRTSFFGITNNGYVHDVTTGERLNDIHNIGVREAVTILPEAFSALQWNLSVDYERNDSANVLNQPGPGGERISYTGFRTDSNALTPYLTGEKARFGQGALVKSYGATSNIALDFAAGTLNLITGYRGLNQQLAVDFPAASLGDLTTADTVPTGEITLAQDLTSHQISQEMKWTAKLGDAFNYTTGLFYLYEQNGNDYGQVLGLAPGVALPLNDQYFRNQTKSEAAYLQGDYKVTSELTATLGGRVTHEIKDVTARPNAPGLGYTTEDVEAAGYSTHLTTTQFTPRLALQYQFDPNLMVFASATRGFQGGGWNGLTGANPIDFNAFGPETIWSYETGFRFESPANHLRLNATLFYQDVKDYQLLSDNPNTRSFDTSNAANLYAYGIEATVQWRPIEPLTLSSNIGSMKAGYYAPTTLVTNQQAACRGGDAASCGAGIVRADGALGSPVYTPALDLTGSASYELRFASFSLTPTFTAHFVSKEWFDNANTPGYSAAFPNVGGQTKPRTLIDAGVTYSSHSIPLSVTAECKNCTMVDYGITNLLGYDYFNTPGGWDLRVDYKF